MELRPRALGIFILHAIVVGGCSQPPDDSPPPGTGGAGGMGDGGMGGTSTASTGGMGGMGGGGQGGEGGAACGPCVENASCNMAGVCACNSGFKDDAGECVDIDECLEAFDDCPASATCTNTPGSFACTCPPGTVGEPKELCEERFVEIAAAAYHTCVRRTDDSVFCFGNGGSGKLGNSLTANQPAPVQAGAANNWSHIVAGSNHTCGIKKTGNLWCWGSNGFGQLGVGNTDSQTLPQFISLERTFTSVAAGDNHVCAVESDGGLFCFGRNNAGQLGLGNNDQKFVPTAVNVDSMAMTQEKDWAEVFAGRDTTCATKQDGRLYCWGQNSELQVSKPGAGTVTLPYLVETAPMAGDTDWASASIGFSTCALKKDGRLYCWGRANEGQLGTGALAAANATPQSILLGKVWKKVRINAWHACAIDDQFALWCWGRNHAGQVSANAPGWVLAPMAVAPGTVWSDFAVGAVHTGGVTQDGRVLMWGSRVYGQLGDDKLSLWTTMAATGAATDWSSVAGYGESGCALNALGELHCWGSNESGQFGLNDNKSRAEPTKVDSAGSVTKVALGRQHACIINAAGKIACSGRNAQGQLGRATNTPATTFAEILTTGKPYDGLSWKEIAAGEEHNCAISMNGTLWCWGRTTEGQIGLKNPTTGSLIQLELVVGEVPPTDWVSVAAGQFHTCASRADGSVWCWGRNVEGQIGNGLPASGKIAPFSLGTGWKGPVATGVNHTCAIKQNGTLWCWGRNSNNQLGDNTTVDRPSPIQVDNTMDWAYVTAGNASTCAGKTGGALLCWGVNSLGHLGLGDTGQRKIPTTVTGSFLGMNLGFQHGCAITTDGALVCGGSGEFGQNARGDGIVSAPVPIAASY